MKLNKHPTSSEHRCEGETWEGEEATFLKSNGCYGNRPYLLQQMVDKVQSVHLHKVLQVAVGTARYVQEEGEKFGTADRRGTRQQSLRNGRRYLRV